MSLNGWKWRAVDGAGKPVESAPGKTSFASFGPTKLSDMKQAAQILLDNRRRDAIRDGEKDPGYAYVEDSFEKIEGGPGHDLIPGVYRPAGAVPIQLPTDPKPAE